MSKLTAAALALLVTLAVLAARENQRDRAHIEALQSVPAHPPILWFPSGQGPWPYVCQPWAHAQGPVVTVPMALEEMP